MGETLSKACSLVVAILILTIMLLAAAVILGALVHPAGASYKGDDIHDQTTYRFQATPAAPQAAQDLGQEAGAFSAAQPQDQTPTAGPPVTATGTPYQWPTCRPTGIHEGCTEWEPGTLVPRAFVPLVQSHAMPTATTRPTAPAPTLTATDPPAPTVRPTGSAGH